MCWPERTLYERQWVLCFLGYVALGPVVHLVHHLRWRGNKHLRPERLDPNDGPCLVLAFHKDGVKVEPVVLDQSRDQNRPLHARVLELRVRELAHVAEHHGNGVGPLSHREAHALEPSTQSLVSAHRNGHPKDRFGKEGRGRAREHDV